MFPRETYVSRRDEMKARMESGLILLLGNSESPMNYADNCYRFRQDSTFLYFFGLDQPDLAGVTDTRPTADLAVGMLSIPAAKGFEVGSGFAGTRMRGSDHNDPYVKKGHSLGTVTNHSGGIQGGISNGEPIVFRVAFKPPATIGVAQRTADYSGGETTLEARGRHDPCVVPRAVPIVEAMAALVLADLALIQ